MSQGQQPSSADTGATPQSVDSPETGTPASPGEMPKPKPDATVEELKARIAELEHSHSNAKEELGRHWKKLAAYEKQEKEAEAARKAAEEAQLSELERTQKQHAELQSQYNTLLHELQEERVHRAVEQHAGKLNFKYPEVAAKLLDWAELEYEENGKPKNVDKLLDKIAKAMPDLVRAEQAPAQTPQGQAAEPAQPRAPAIPPFAGRSSIPSPGGTTPPGKLPTLDDYYRSQRR